MKHDAERGTIEEGKQADVILVDGDPTANIGDIRKVELTVRGRVLYRNAELYRELGIAPVTP